MALFLEIADYSLHQAQLWGKILIQRKALHTYGTIHECQGLTLTIVSQIVWNFWNNISPLKVIWQELLQQTLLKVTALYIMKHIMATWFNPSKQLTCLWWNFWAFAQSWTSRKLTPVISNGEKIFPEIPANEINEDFWSYIYTGGLNEEAFLNWLNITFQDCVQFEKDTKNQSDCSLWFELRKPHNFSSTCHRIFIRQNVRGILIPYVQKLSILLTSKTCQPKLKKH